MTWSTTEPKWKDWDWTRAFAVIGWELTAWNIALPSTTCENIFGWHFFSLPSILQDLFHSVGKLICIYLRNSFLFFFFFVHLQSEFCAKLPRPSTESHTNFSAATTIYSFVFTLTVQYCQPHKAVVTASNYKDPKQSVFCFSAIRQMCDNLITLDETFSGTTVLTKWTVINRQNSLTVLT